MDASLHIVKDPFACVAWPCSVWKKIMIMNHEQKWTNIGMNDYEKSNVKYMCNDDVIVRIFQNNYENVIWFCCDIQSHCNNQHLKLSKKL